MKSLSDNTITFLSEKSDYPATPKSSQISVEISVSNSFGGGIHVEKGKNIKFTSFSFDLSFDIPNR